jgi:hypothetical protein
MGPWTDWTDLTDLLVEELAGEVSRIRAAAAFESGFGILRGSRRMALGFGFMVGWIQGESSILTSSTFSISEFSQWKVMRHGDLLESASMEYFVVPLCLW